MKNLFYLFSTCMLFGCSNDQNSVLPNENYIDSINYSNEIIDINEDLISEIKIDRVKENDSSKQNNSTQNEIESNKVFQEKTQTGLSENDYDEFEVYLKRFIEDLLTNEKRLDYFIYHNKAVFQNYINDELGYYIAYNQGVMCDLYSENSYYGDNYDNWENDRFEENITFKRNKDLIKIFRNQMPKGGFCEPTEEESGFYYTLEDIYYPFSKEAEPINDANLLSRMLWSIHKKLGYSEDVFDDSGSLFYDFRDPYTRNFVPKHVFDSISEIYFDLSANTGWEDDDIIKKRKLISKCIKVKVLENGWVTYNIYFVNSNKKWYFHILDKCDCNA